MHYTVILVPSLSLLRHKLKTYDSQFAFQEEYQKEGIDWSFQNFVDNRACLDLIEGRTSVFSLMNEVIKRFVRSKIV